MDRPATNIKKLPPHLLLIALLSGAITIGFSLIYIVLGIIYFVYRTKCDTGVSGTATGAEYFWTTIFRVYILSSKCTDEKLEVNNLTNESTVFLLMCITMAISIVCLILGGTLIAIVQDGTQSRYLKSVIIIYVCGCVASLTVDLTTASHFGVDYTYLTSILRILTAGSPSNYLTEVIRQGAFWLMAIALKGYFAHLINGVLLILLVIYYQDYEKYTKSAEHSIHKVGALTAFDQRPKTADEIWPRPEMYNNNSPSPRGPYLNSSFVEDDTPPRSPMRATPRRPEYPSNNNSFDRSNSWHHSQDHSTPSSRPFSYLEDIKRPVPSRPPPSPAVESPWRQNQWNQNQGPPVPAPDYSPTQPRRLKSALKPAYM